MGSGFFPLIAASQRCHHDVLMSMATQSAAVSAAGLLLKPAHLSSDPSGPVRQWLTSRRYDCKFACQCCTYVSLNIACSCMLWTYVAAVVQAVAQAPCGLQTIAQRAQKQKRQKP